jgi:hypothetical protein
MTGFRALCACGVTERQRLVASFGFVLQPRRVTQVQDRLGLEIEDTAYRIALTSPSLYSNFVSPKKNSLQVAQELYLKCTLLQELLAHYNQLSPYFIPHEVYWNRKSSCACASFSSQQSSMFVVTETARVTAIQVVRLAHSHLDLVYWYIIL